MLDSAAYDIAEFSHMTYYIIIVFANTNRGPGLAAAVAGVVQAISLADMCELSQAVSFEQSLPIKD